MCTAAGGAGCDARSRTVDANTPRTCVRARRLGGARSESQAAGGEIGRSGLRDGRASAASSGRIDARIAKRNFERCRHVAVRFDLLRRDVGADRAPWSRVARGPGLPAARAFRLPLDVVARRDAVDERRHRARGQCRRRGAQNAEQQQDTRNVAHAIDVRPGAELFKPTLGTGRY